MTTKHEAALREMEEAYQSLVPGTWMNHAEGTLRVCWPTIRDALTAQGEVWQAGFKAGWDSAIARDEPGKTFAEIDPAPSAPPVPYTTPCPECEGRGFTRRYVDGARESDKCSWCHGGGVVPSAPPAECPNCGEPGEERYWAGHFHEGEWLCPRTPAHSAGHGWSGMLSSQ